MKTEALLIELERNIANFDKVVVERAGVNFEMWQHAFFQRLRLQLAQQIIRRCGFGNEAEFIRSISSDVNRNELIRFFEAAEAGVILSVDALTEALWVLGCDLSMLTMDS